MNISAWSIRNPVPAILLFVLLTFAGLYSFKKMGVQNFPDIDFPMINVTASMEGASPAQLETDVARKLEDQIATIDKVKHINTTITDGVVSITVEFQFEKDGEEALSQIRNAIDITRPELPTEMQPPVISKVTTSGAPFATFVVNSKTMSLEQLSWLVDNTLEKQIRLVKGVGSVKRVGGVDREISINVDENKLALLGITPNLISTQLRSVQKNFSAGSARIVAQNQAIRVLGAVDNVQQIRELSIPLNDGSFVTLSSIATIEDAFSERSEMAYLDQQEVIAFQVTRAKGSSEVDVALRLDQKISELRELYPDTEFFKAYDSTEPVKENYVGSMNMIYEGAILAVLVVFWFLRDWRATLVSATALPLSIIPTFVAMHYLGFSINLLTLLSLALVIGILVDDAIVEVENIMRHLQMGKTPLQASMEAANEIGLAVVATTFTLVAVFLPTGFLSGVTGKFFEQFGLTAAISVLFSLLVARLITPMLAAYIMKPNKHVEKDSWLMKKYLLTTAWCQHHRAYTMLGATVFFVLSLAIVPLLPTGFVPPSDQGQTQVAIELPPGSRLQDSQATSLEAIQRIKQLDEVVHVFASVGSSFSGGSGPGQESSNSDARKSTLIVSLTKRTEREHSQIDIEQQIRQVLSTIPGARFTVGGTNSGETLQITLASDSSDAILAATQALERDLRTLDNIGSITSGLSLQRPEIQIIPDYRKAASLNITSQQLANILRLATYGDYSQELAKLNLPERQIPIRVRSDDNVREQVARLEQLRIPVAGGMTTLGSIASIKIDGGLSEIQRLDRSRQTTVKVELSGRSIGDVMAEVAKFPSLTNLPAGVTQVESGEAENMTELFASFGFAMLVGLLCIYVVLVLLFHDFLQPITILAAIPLSAGGAFFALLMTNNSLSLPSVIGVIMLMGVVTKNSILLVEYAVIARREHGMDRFTALMDACHKRARPIVMTTIAMGFGMLPTAIGIGSDPSFRGPMAIVVIGGLITSTFLSLLVIPVVYTIVDDFMSLLKKCFRKPSFKLDQNINNN